MLGERLPGGSSSSSARFIARCLSSWRSPSALSAVPREERLVEDRHQLEAEERLHSRDDHAAFLEEVLDTLLEGLWLAVVGLGGRRGHGASPGLHARRPQALDGGDERREIDRLDEVVLEAGGAALVDVLGPAVAGERDAAHRFLRPQRA